MIHLLLAAVAFSVIAAWSSRLWAVSLPQAILFSTVAAAAYQGWRGRGAFRFPPMLAAPALLSSIGLAQLALRLTVYRLPTAHSWLDWAGYLVCGWLAAQVSSAEQIRRQWLTMWTCFAGCVSTLALLTSFTSPFHIFWIVPVRFEQVFGPYVYRNHLAAFAELSLPIALYLAIQERARRYLFLFAAVLLIAAVTAAASRTGLILLALEMFTMLVLASYKGWLALKASIVFSIVLAMFVIVGAGVTGVSPVRARFAESHPYRVRYEILLSTLDMARSRPITGWGLGTFQTVYPRFARIDPGVVVNEAHSDWAQWAAEGGVLALAAMILLAAWSIRKGLQTGWGLGMAAVFCHALVDYPFEEPSVVLLFMLLAGLASQSAGRERNPGWQPHSAQRHSHPIVQEWCHASGDPVDRAKHA